MRTKILEKETNELKNWFKSQPKGDKAMLIYIVLSALYFAIGVARLII